MIINIVSIYAYSIAQGPEFEVLAVANKLLNRRNAPCKRQARNITWCSPWLAAIHGRSIRLDLDWWTAACIIIFSCSHVASMCARLISWITQDAEAYLKRTTLTATAVNGDEPKQWIVDRWKNFIVVPTALQAFHTLMTCIQQQQQQQYTVDRPWPPQLVSEIFHFGPHEIVRYTQSDRSKR